MAHAHKQLFGVCILEGINRNHQNALKGQTANIFFRVFFINLNIDSARENFFFIRFGKFARAQNYMPHLRIRRVSTKLHTARYRI